MAPITITYTLHPTSPSPSSSSSTPSTTALHQALNSIKAHLPLRNLHWKPSSRTSIRTIQEVDVNLIELGDAGPGTVGVGGAGSSRLGGSVMEGPLVNMCLVVCEDAETYKNSTKSFIRDWLSLLSARRNAQAPLIVLINPYSSAAASSGKTVFGRDKGVLGKLKADFNVAKRDRCVQVNLPQEGTEDPAAWPEFLSKLKESIVTAFDEAVVEKEEEVKRGEAQRLMVGWNFCTWFLVKESLATSFESVGLAEDALVIYEELEATFFQILKEQNLTWFGKLGATHPKDDSIPVLDLRAKHYREMLQSSNISIFDFRVYVFARQAILLGQLGRITEIAKRGQWFVASLTRRLRESEPDLAEHFIESWTYTACMDIVQKCDEWSRIDRPNGDYSGLIAYESARSELLDIARVQVERIGVACGHLPDTYPFSQATAIIPLADDVLFETFDVDMDGSDDPTSPADNAKSSSRPRLTISNPQLLDAQADFAKFRNLYLNLTKRAILAYEACGKANSVIRLKADLAALALHSQEWQAAYDFSRNLAKECAELLIWEPVAKFALEGAIRSHRELSLSIDEEWLNLALAYLRVCAMLKGDQVTEELPRVLNILQDLQLPLEVHDHQAFEISLIDDQAREGRQPDTMEIRIQVINRLSTSVTIGRLEVEFELDGNDDRISFFSYEAVLEPGVNALNATCTTSVQGLYKLRGTTLNMGALSFQYYSSNDDALIKMKRSDGCVRAALRMPDRIALDEDSQVMVQIQSNACTMRNTKLQLVSCDQGIRYALERAAVLDRSDVTTSAKVIEIGDIVAGEEIQVMIPYLGVSSADYTLATIMIHYDSLDSASTSTGNAARSYTDTQTVSMSLPLTVNVQDFFRPKSLLSHFTVASDGKENLRIRSVELRPPKQGYEVQSCRKAWDQTATVTPEDSLSCLFKIRQSGTPSSSAADAVLRLVIQYMTIDEELSSILEPALSSQPRHIRRLVRARLDDRSEWLGRYLATADMSDIFDTAWQRGVGPGSKSESESEPKGELEAFVESLGDVTAGTRWRTLEIPVEIPSRRLLTTVHISHSTPPNPTEDSRGSQIQTQIYEGRAISLIVRFDTTLTWSTPSQHSSAIKRVTGQHGSGDGDNNEDDDSWLKRKERKMVFDIQPNPEDWIVLGKKKGFYIADGTIKQREIVIVPIHQGYLPLPAVTVSLLPQVAASVTAGSSLTESESQSQSKSSVREIESDSDTELDMMCETYVSNAAEMIQVLPAKGGVTALVPLESSWEVEAERRI